MPKSEGILGAGAEMRADWVFVDVVAMLTVILAVLNTQFPEAVFPNGEFRFEAKGKSTLDELHRFLYGDVGRGGEEKVEMIGHEYECVELITPLSAVVMEDLEEQVGIGIRLKEAPPLCGDGSDEEGAKFGWEEARHRLRLTAKEKRAKMTMVRRYSEGCGRTRKGHRG